MWTSFEGKSDSFSFPRFPRFTAPTTHPAAAARTLLRMSLGALSDRLMPGSQDVEAVTVLQQGSNGFHEAILGCLLYDSPSFSSIEHCLRAEHCFVSPPTRSAMHATDFPSKRISTIEILLPHLFTRSVSRNKHLPLR